MDLYIIRHGPCDDAYLIDDEKPLTKVGEKIVQRIAKQAAQQWVAPAELWVSPLIRAQQTARFFEAHWPTKRQLAPWLLPGTQTSDILTQLECLTPASPIALIGHMPSVGRLIATLSGGLQAPLYALPRGGAAHLKINSLVPGQSRIESYLDPQSLEF